MIISVNWLKKYTDIDLPVEELVELIGSRIVEVESVTSLTDKYKDTVVVRVEECSPIPDTDHLNATKIDDGGLIKNVERDNKGLVSVVCGAPNIHAGMLVVWLPPNSVVPDSYNDKEPFVLQSKELRGVMSNGMIASAKELDLYDEHSGILEVDENVKPGAKFADVYDLNDYLLDIENKSLTHRPDMFGIIGFAREIAAIQDKTFVTPEWLAETNPEYKKIKPTIDNLNIKIESSGICERYQVVVMSDANAGLKSPLWVQTLLSRVGVRPVNAVVDVTNYLMMLTGQPLHAFDYDKLIKISGGKPEIEVRLGLDGEKLELLDGRTINVSVEDILITAGGKPVGLAGAMGGANTAIDDTTKNIIIESATFNLYSLRSTQMRHGIFSEAVTRFTKGQPAALTAPVLSSAIELLEEWSGAKRVSEVVDSNNASGEDKPITIKTSRLNSILGTSMSIGEIESTLRMVEFACLDVDHDTLKVAAPYWRSDIHITEDVVEEVGRIKGFDSILPTLPVRDSSAVMPSGYDRFKYKLRQILSETGASEVLTYSFVHGDILLKSGQSIKNSYRITNSISPDLQYYRQSLMPSLLNLVHPNIKKGFDNFALFEINKVHPKSSGLTDESVPVELDSISLVIAGKNNIKSSPYYRAKSIVDYLQLKLGISLVFEKIVDIDDVELAPFEPKRSGIIRSEDGVKIGYVGEFKTIVKKNFKLVDNAAGFELSLSELFQTVASKQPDYIPSSKYPSVERDLCFQVGDKIQYSDLYNLVVGSCTREDISSVIEPIDVYQPAESSTRNITLRIKLTSNSRTLTGDEAKVIVDDIANRASKELSAKMI